MDASARRPAHVIALAATLLVIVMTAASVYAALATRGSFGLIMRVGSGHAVVTWVAPNGVAWNAGVRPGDRMVDGWTALIHASGAPRTVPVRLVVPSASRASLLAAGVGLCLTLLSLLVLLKSPDVQAGRAFWRATLVLGGTLGLLPAGFRGTLWAVALTFVALAIQGPMLLDLIQVFPRKPRPRGRWRRFLPWAPALALLLVYPLAWWRPGQLFDPAENGAHVLLAAYIIATAGGIAVELARPHDARQRAQLRLVGLGLIGGLTPFVALTLLPLILTGQPLAPSQITILALAIFPASVGIAIARSEFLGVTSLVHRRVLRIGLGVILLAAMALAAGTAVAMAVRVQQGWQGWRVDVVAGAASALAALLYAPVLRWLTRRAERFFLRDAYDMAGTLLDLSADLAGAAPGEMGPLVVARLGAILDLSVAILVTSEQSWSQVHPRSAVPEGLRDALEERARAMLDGPLPDAAFAMHVQYLPVLFVPVRDGRFMPVREGRRTRALLGLGPKRSGDRYTEQDRVLLGALARHLAVLFGNHDLRAHLDAQIAALDRLAAERQVLVDRLVSATEDEQRRIAALLHDEAIQMGGEIVRQTNDLLALPHLPLDAHVRAAAISSLASALVAQLRQVAGDLYPPPLQTAGLVPALRALLREVEQGGPRCCLVVDPIFAQGHVLPAHPAHEVTLYRIAREAIGNALRHAGAATILVTLMGGGTGLILRIRDDGVGFVPRPVGTLLARHHLGLALIEQRVRELDGTLDIATGPGQGTTITVSVPAPVSSPTRPLTEFMREEVYPWQPVSSS